MNIRKEGIFLVLILLLLIGPLVYLSGRRAWLQRQLDHELGLAHQEGIVVDSSKVWPDALGSESENAKSLVQEATRSLRVDVPAWHPKWKARNFSGFRVGSFFQDVLQDTVGAKRLLRAIEPELALMESASHKRFLIIERPLDDPNTRSMEFHEFQFFVRAFCVRSWLAYSNGNRVAGRNDLFAAARLCALLRQEPTVTATVQANEAERSIFYTIRHILSSSTYEPGPMLLMEDTLAALGPLRDYRHYLRGEFLRDRADLERMLRPGGPRRHGIQGHSGLPTWRLREARIQAEIELVRGYREFYKAIAKVKGTEFDAAFEVSGIALRIEQSRWRYYTLFAGPADHIPEPYGGALYAYIRAPLRAKALRRVTLAFAKCLEIRKRTGIFPNELPEMGEDSVDPYRQKPLSYRKTSKGFLVYSVGNDEIDNGGHISSTSMPSRDIVAAYP